MKKIVVTLAALVAMAILTAPQAAALGEDMSSGDILAEQNADSGANELGDALPDEAADYMDEAGISLEGLQSGEGIGLDAFLGSVEDIVSNVTDTPVAVCAGIIGIIVLCSMIDSLRDSSSNSVGVAASLAATVAVSLAAMVPIAQFIEKAADTLSKGCTFGAVFMPIFAGIIAVFGQGATALGYSAFMTALNEIIMLSVSGVILPMMRMLLAISAVSAISPSMRLDGIVRFFDKNSKWILGLLAALLVGVLGISSIAASATDGAGGKAARFVIANTVPIVGRAISEALGAVQSCVGILRSSVGSFGMVAEMFIFLPTVIECVIWLLCINFCAALAEVFGTQSIHRLLKSISGVIATMLALLIFVSVVLIASTAVILGQRGNAA
ncbi:MAG: hypothetical protein IJP17_02535 [Clostridia bacterium]|nr:hypothetical protein [Clostridia bacterium]